MRNSASTSGAWPICLMAMYSQYVPTENVPALNQNPSTAARRGVAPSHSQMSTAGMRMAIGHQPNGAKDSDSSMPATSAAALPTKRRSTIARRFTLSLAAGLPAARCRAAR